MLAHFTQKTSQAEAVDAFHRPDFLEAVKKALAEHPIR